MPKKSSLPHREKSIKTTKLNTNLDLRHKSVSYFEKKTFWYEVK